MSSYIIQGRTKLEGEVSISGSKNASLPILAATILNAGITKLYNVPNIHDTQKMIEILQFIGCTVKKKENKESSLLMIMWMHILILQHVKDLNYDY